MASKAMRIVDPSCDTGTWRAAIQRRQTSGRSISSRANCSMPSGHPDLKCAPEISARTRDDRARPRMPSSGHVADDSRRPFGATSIVASVTGAPRASRIQV
jgi:hypothetical protein